MIGGILNDPEEGPVQLAKGKIIGKKWKIVKKLGEGGCGAVYKVVDVNDSNNMAALKAESNFVSGGSVLKLEVEILRRLENGSHVAKLLGSGKKERFCYMIMTLLGDSLSNLLKRLGRNSSVSTQVRVGINVLYGVKQIHDIGFVHRDLKPANIAVGRPGTPQARYLHILDFGLAREFVVKGSDGKLYMRRARQKALFRGTTRYCSINTHERLEQGRVDDLWSLLYMLAEMRGPLPWAKSRNKEDVHKIKKTVEMDLLLMNSPVQFMQFAEHLNTLNYYTRPKYDLLYGYLKEVMDAGHFTFMSPWDWEGKDFSRHNSCSAEVLTAGSAEVTDQNNNNKDMSKERLTGDYTVPLATNTPPLTPPRKDRPIDENNPFPMEDFAYDPLGF